MARVARHEEEILKTYIRDAVLLFWCHGYRVAVESDFGKLARCFRAADQYFYAAFDPAMRPPFDDGLWLNVTDASGATVATSAEAVYREADFAELVASGRLWGDAGARGRTEGLWNGPSVPLVGDVGHGGAMWVRPDYRGRGLAGPVESLSRAVALWRMGIDCHVGLMYGKDAGSGLQAAYGYTHAEKCIDGYCPAFGKAVELHAVWMSRTELLQDLLGRGLKPDEIRSAVSIERDAEHVGGDRQHFEQLSVAV